MLLELKFVYIITSSARIVHNFCDTVNKCTGKYEACHMEFSQKGKALQLGLQH